MAANKKRKAVKRTRAEILSTWPPIIEPCPKCGSTARQFYEGIMQPCLCARRARRRSKVLKVSPEGILADLARELRELPHPWMESLAELLSLTATLEGEVLHAVLEKVERISVDGLDPDWQAAELRKIVNEAKRAH